MKRIILLSVLLCVQNAFACPEFKFCVGESAVSNDGYKVTIVSMQSNQTAVIRTTQGSTMTYATQYLAKMRGCNSAGLCAGDAALTADGHDTEIAGIYGCGSTDAAITVTSTQGGYLRYASKYLTKFAPPPPPPVNGPSCQ